MSEKPKSIVYLRPDTLGDLILFSPALSAFLSAWPEARHTLVVRPGCDALSPLFPPAVDWCIAQIDPFKHKPSDCRAELAQLLGTLAALEPDLILAPALNHTWLEAAVAARFPGVRSVIMGGAEIDPLFANALRLELGVEIGAAFRETVPIDANARDVENQRRFAECLLGRPLAPVLPSLSVPAAARRLAGAVLAGHGLDDGGWAAVFAGGLANVPLKAWPAARFGELIAGLELERGIGGLLLAHVDEAAFVGEITAAAAARGARRLKVWLGRDGELPILAGILERARFYVGHDTGAMHLSAALDRPTVGIFGGGHWPRFRPAARRGVAVVQPLPCFGCQWDCHFLDGPCVKTLPAADVRQAIELVLESGDRPCDTVVEARHFGAETLALIAASARRHAALQADRLARQHTIEELKHATDAKDREILALKSEADRKDVEIAALKQAAEERSAERDAIKAELEGECAGKDREIAGLKAEADHKDREIESLKAVCNERESAILRLDGHVKEFQRVIRDKDRHIDNLDADLASLSAALVEARSARARLEETLGRLSPDAALWSQGMHDKDVHIANLEAIRRAREEEVADVRRALAAREQVIANYAAGHRNLELANHYGRLLSEKEAMIRDLHRACVEREKVIRQLALASSESTGLLHRLGLFAGAWIREKVVEPANRWLFQKVVQDYWMQIGILQHYPPRPLAWDARVRPSRAAPDRLPRVGLVTPSYEQAAYIESTILSVLNQNYPKLSYAVQDGGSPDDTPAIVARYASRLRHWESAPDRGQADAIHKGFDRIAGDLGPEDVMAWLNSDDLLAPRALAYVAGYFARHPEVDVIYGHRIIIDGDDREIGRWIMPRHDPASLEWIDYVPQETLFWRKRAWDLVGGIDPSFQFALDWDLLARFQQAGCRIVRVPRFIGCFRLHPRQKTSQVIHTTGAEEMSRIRTRFHGASQNDFVRIDHYARKIRFRGALTARLHALGLRW